MITKNKDIVIVVACNSHYLIMLAVLLKSIEINHQSGEHIQLWIIEENISKNNKKRLENSLSKEVFSITWISSKTAIPKGMTLPLDKNTYPLNIFMRLFIPYFLPKELDKALYLDVDMLVLEDISKLWNIDIGDNIVGAVTDSICKTIGIGIKNYKELNLDSSSPYFNSGLLLMNIKKWLEYDVTPKVIDCVNQNRDVASFSDQYGLNVVLANKWLELDPLWNYYSNGNLSFPYLIHFFHRKPFYKTYPYNETYQKLFYEYLDKTAWKGTKPVGELKRYFIKIGNVVNKIPLLFKKKNHSS